MATNVRKRPSRHIKRVEAPTLILSRNGVPDSLVVQKCKLLVVSGPAQGQEFVVDKDQFSIGAGEQNAVVLTDSAVSKHHCEIQLLPDGYLIRDMGSTNGTMVKGVRVTEAFLNQGAEFQLGNTKIIFCPLQEARHYALSHAEAFGELIGHSVSMRRVFHLAETYAPTDATILIEGETGTGKEVLAEELHRHSKRKDRPFVVIDCAALARELTESELFGHTKGSFTGATTDRKGAFEHGNGGTVFLDEISDLHPDLQPKLLRVLEKREIRRVGSNDRKTVDVRIICATNKKLEGEVNTGRFREDLFYRLSVVHIDLAPLRKRKQDIALLTRKFVKEFHGADALNDLVDFDRTMEAFANHDWPGNVRELRNVVEIAACAGQRPIDLQAFLYLGRVKSQEQQGRADAHSADRPFKDAKSDLIGRFERDYIRDMLERHGGNISRAAQEAGIERAYLQRLIRKYDMKA